MIKNKIDINKHQYKIIYRTNLLTDIDIIFDILFKIKWDNSDKQLKFMYNDSKIYLEKEKNKCVINHKYLKRKDEIKIDHFSLWLAFEHFRESLKDDHINILNDLNLDHKVKISIH